MEPVFIDSHYLIALINRRDQWHSQAVELSRELERREFVLTDSVFVETLNYFSEYRADIKLQASETVRSFSNALRIKVVEQTSELVESGIRLYRARLDKGFSLTDCISMVVSREHGITSILTNDHHFLQEGFEILLRHSH